MADWILNAAEKFDVKEITLDVKRHAIRPEVMNIDALRNTIKIADFVIDSELKAAGLDSDYILEAEMRIKLDDSSFKRRFFHCTTVVVDKEGKQYKSSIPVSATEKPFDVSSPLKASADKKYRMSKISKILIIFYIVYLPLRVIFDFGFTNALADFLLSFVTIFSPVLLLIFFPFRHFRKSIRTLIGFMFGIAILWSLFFLIFQLFLLSDVFRTGQDPSLLRTDNYDSSHLIHQVTYVGDCGATCSLYVYEVKELVLFGTVKLRIPGTFVELPN